MSDYPQMSDETKEQTAHIFRKLRMLMDALGQKPNRNDLAVLVISACILEGRDTRGRIQGTLRTLGFKPPHVASVLNHGTGDDPELHGWQLNCEGRFQLHPARKAVMDA